VAVEENLTHRNTAQLSHVETFVVGSEGERRKSGARVASGLIVQLRYLEAHSVLESGTRTSRRSERP
jgi:hypothetical protein